MKTSQEKIREEAEGCGFERRNNAFGFVGPVVQDLGDRFAVKDIKLVESYRQSDFYLVLKARAPLAVSLIGVAEIRYGLEVKNWGAPRRDLRHRFLARFTTLLADVETAILRSRIKSNCEKKGRPIAFADAWIAAAALAAQRTARDAQR